LKCIDVVKDSEGNITELRCTYDPETSGGKAPDGRKVKGTIHWVSAEHAIEAEVRQYDVLFSQENPDDVPEGKDWKDLLNPDSLQVMTGCKLEPSLATAKPGERFQFERLGYFCVDPKDSATDGLVFNRTVTLKDAWAKKRK
jgi:glutaminyl-tRNA synthetase